MSETKIGYKDILKQKEYMKMILAALINRFGDSIDAIASTWLVYEITGNAAWSAIIFGINKLPTVFITPLAGAWVEGGNKKSIMVVTDLIRAVCVLCRNLLPAWIFTTVDTGADQLHNINSRSISRSGKHSPDSQNSCKGISGNLYRWIKICEDRQGYLLLYGDYFVYECCARSF